MTIIKGLFRLFLVAVSAGILFLGLSKNLQKRLDARGLIPNQYRFGDLYNVSCLEKFKDANLEKNDRLTEADKPRTKVKNVDLYTIGDSFTTMDTSFYAGNSNRHIWLGTQDDTVQLNQGRHSILVIQVIERTIQERLAFNSGSLYIERGFQIKGMNRRPNANKPGSDQVSFWWEQFSDQVNQRLEFLLFNFDLFLKIKELKANVMLSWFGRTHTGSVISRDRRFLFYQVEADPKSVLSPFRNVSEAAVDSVVSNMNSLRDYYRKAGFDEVYFCFVPNKVTVCERGRFTHNDQISRIERHPGLKAPLLSLHRTLYKHPEWFHKGDGHWNVHGKRLWLRTVNGLVRQWGKK